MDIKFFDSTGNVENRIISLEDLPESCEAGRRIGNTMINEMMTMHYRGLKAPHEIRGRNNFKIECMMDECGDSSLNGKIEFAQVECEDRTNKFEVVLKREDFWF